jgi:VanZ family protein
MSYFWWRLAPAAAYLGGIFYAGLIRFPALPETELVPSDKLLHALVFGGLSLLLVRTAPVLVPRASLAKRLLFGAFGASFFGALLELCQAFVPYRSAEVADWLADSLGAGLSLCLLALALHVLRSRRARLGKSPIRSVGG